MSILIKGMKMPEHCGYCRFRYDGICHALQKTQYKMEDCPLVPVPEHGRLGDLDKAYKDALMQVSLAFASHNKEQAAMAVANVISNAPTIIPAEEGE